MTQLEAYLLSIGLEGVAAVVIAVASGGRASRAGLAAVGGTSLTHPFVWHGALLLYPLLGYLPTLILVEAGAVGVEAGVYRILAVNGWARALLFSFLANAASFLAGLMLTLA